MTPLLNHVRSLWAGCLFLVFVCSALFWYQQEREKTYEKTHQSVSRLMARQDAFTKDRAFFTTRKALLKQMTAQKFVCDVPPSYPELKGLILHMAKACALEKIRLETEPSRRLDTLHHRPIVLYFQTALDTDLYTFLTRLDARLPAATKWTFLSLFQTPDGRLQGEVHGALTNHAS
ncbi:MAG: hypothetical protein H2057_05945 [Alphaproteobacteria bacterium]|nr:hypothetical protein [Alphaproteobacteria bacterium]